MEHYTRADTYRVCTEAMSFKPSPLTQYQEVKNSKALLIREGKSNLPKAQHSALTSTLVIWFNAKGHLNTNS